MNLWEILNILKAFQIPSALFPFSKGFALGGIKNRPFFPGVYVEGYKVFDRKDTEKRIILSCYKILLQINCVLVCEKDL